jgi:hypothetical protein
VTTADLHFACENRLARLLRSNAHEMSGGAMEELRKQLAEHVALSIEMVGILVTDRANPAKQNKQTKDMST